MPCLFFPPSSANDVLAYFYNRQLLQRTGVSIPELPVSSSQLDPTGGMTPLYKHDSGYLLFAPSLGQGTPAQRLREQQAPPPLQQCRHPGCRAQIIEDPFSTISFRCQGGHCFVRELSVPKTDISSQFHRNKSWIQQKVDMQKSQVS